MKGEIRLLKWPFFLADLLLVGLAAAFVFQAPHPLTSTQMFLVALCVFAGGGFAVFPFFIEYSVSSKLLAMDVLSQAMDQVKSLQAAANSIHTAQEQWRAAETASKQMLHAANNLSERMTAEVKGFCDFLQRSNDQEKANLRLEMEKLRRAEGEWLQVTLRTFDHIYALNQAAHRSGRADVIHQLDQFQNACRDILRRVGLVAFTPEPGLRFDQASHQPPEGSDPERLPVISQTLAPGYTFQGRLLRKALVALEEEPAPELEARGLATPGFSDEEETEPATAPQTATLSQAAADLPVQSEPAAEAEPAPEEVRGEELGPGAETQPGDEPESDQKPELPTEAESVAEAAPGANADQVPEPQPEEEAQPDTNLDLLEESEPGEEVQPSERPEPAAEDEPAPAEEVAPPGELAEEPTAHSATALPEDSVASKEGSEEASAVSSDSPPGNVGSQLEKGAEETAELPFESGIDQTRDPRPERRGNSGS